MSVVWFNGKFVDGAIPLDSRDRGFLLGDGLFETIMVHERKPIWLNAHLARMASAAVELGIIFDVEIIRAGVAAVLENSHAGFEALRITLSRGSTARGLGSTCISPNLLVTLDEFNTNGLPQALNLKVSTIRRNETSPSSRLKTLSYIDGIAAAREVSGSADDALMLNTSGHVASATVANIFMVCGNELITPALDQGILPGITRRALLDIAHKVSLAPVERIVGLEEILGADAVFACNSLRFVRPVAKLNDKPLGARPVDDLMKGLRNEIFC